MSASNFLERKNLSIIPLLLITLFWASFYSEGLFQLIGQIKGQLLILTIWIVSLIILKRDFFKTILVSINSNAIEIDFLAIFVLVNAINLLLGRGDIAYANFVKTLLILTIFITTLIQFKRSVVNYKRAVILIMIVYGLISLYVIPILFLNPFIARLYEFSDGEIPWFGSWGFFMPMSMAMPCFIAVSLQYRGIKKLILCIICVLIGIMIILSTFAASVILLLVGLAGFLIFSFKKNIKRFLKICLLFIFLGFIFKLVDFSEIPQIDHMIYKIPAIFTSVKSTSDIDENDPRVRLTMIRVSINSFLEYPLFGVGLYGSRVDGKNVVGFHSGIVDNLAEYGLLGIMWYFGFLIICLRRLLISLSKDYKNVINQARLITFLLFIFGSFADPVFIETAFCSILIILSLTPINPLYKNSEQHTAIQVK